MKHTLVFHLISIAKKLQKGIGFKSAPLLLSYSQASALTVIGSQIETSQKEIATKLHLEPATVVTLIDELEKLKLVKRDSHNDDRRKYDINLTNQGKLKAAQIKKKASKLDHFLRSHLTAKEVKNLQSTLEKLFNSLDHWKGGET